MQYQAFISRIRQVGLWAEGVAQVEPQSQESHVAHNGHAQVHIRQDKLSHLSH